jgi:hypothetical protein
MKRLSWKYLAGLIDGEGCIDMQGSVHPRDRVYYCRPRLRMTLSGEGGKNLLDMLSANFGGHFDPKRTWETNPNWQPAYSWQLTGSAHLRSVLQNLCNHLILKKEQAKFAIWWIDNIGGKQAPEEVRRFGTAELKAMKKDPQRLSEKASIQIRLMMRQSGTADAV